MIKKLSVKNFALIEDLNLDFQNGFTALTGSTGAGKSLVMGSISLLLGSRADKDNIRHGANSAVVSGVFSINPSVKEVLDDLGISYQDEIEIKREIANNSKNTIFINGSSVSLNDLKIISKNLASIHDQRDTFNLLSVDTYLSYLDNDSMEFHNLMDNYYISLFNYQNDVKKKNEIIKKAIDGKDKLEFYEYQIKELEELNLLHGEDQELEEKIDKMANFDKIFQNLKDAYEILNSEAFNYDLIYDAIRHLEKIEEYDNDYQMVRDDLSNSYDLLDNSIAKIKRIVNNLDFDPSELENYQERLYSLNNVKKKYGKNLDELIEYLADIKVEVGLIENYDETIKELEKRVILSKKKAYECGVKLRNYRIKMAQNLEKLVVKEAQKLDLENTRFQVSFNEVNLDNVEFYCNGIDSIDFLVTFNKGEELLPLSHVASGGELSRMMLIFKAINTLGKEDILMIFDEIDSGVSGVTASKIASKLLELSKNNQVFSITHLPQVASSADYQMKIYKSFEDNRTHTNVVYLDLDERILEIAKMLSGEIVSDLAIMQAKEMLNKNPR